MKLPSSTEVSRVNTRRATGKYVRGGDGGNNSGYRRSRFRVARFAATTSRGASLSPLLRDGHLTPLFSCHAKFPADKQFLMFCLAIRCDAAFSFTLTIASISCSTIMFVASRDIRYVTRTRMPDFTVYDIIARRAMCRAARKRRESPIMARAAVTTTVITRPSSSHGILAAVHLHRSSSTSFPLNESTFPTSKEE